MTEYIVLGILALIILSVPLLILWLALDSYKDLKDLEK